MLIQIVGCLIAAGAAAATAALLVWAWPLTRVGQIGAPMLAAAAGAAGALFLQTLGAGALRFTPGLGTIDWVPVAATMIVGAGLAVFSVGAVGLMRVGGRSTRR